MDLNTSSFVNVTLAFWTNENGISIAAEDYQKLFDGESGQSVPQSDSDAHSSNNLLSASQSLTRASSLRSSSLSVHSLINSLLSDQELPNENYTLLHNTNTKSNVSRIAKKLFDNVTNLTNNVNDTFRCFPTDLGTNECLLANGINGTNGTDISLGVSKDRVYWALFLAILPILALFGNILVILRY